MILTTTTQKMLYTIEELSEATGITARTIRYYTTEGLLASPETRGRYALYSEAHLRRLQLVVMLKAAYLPLTTIKDRLAYVSHTNVAALVAGGEIVEDETNETNETNEGTGNRENEGTEDGPEGIPEESAAAYLQRVLANRNAMQNTRTPRAPASFPGLREGEGSDAPGEAWRRLEVLPGVELHFKVPVAPQTSVQIGKLLQYVRNVTKKE